MSVRRLTWMATVLVIMGLVLAACGGATAPAVEPTAVPEATTAAATEAATAVAPAEGERTGAWLDTIVLVEEPSADAAISRLQAGDIDLYAYTVSSREVADKVAADPTLDAYRSFGSYNELTFNPAGPVFEGTGKLNPFAVPAMREAMNCLLDRDYIAQEIMAGLATPRWLPFNTASTDYVRLADVARQLEIKYAYNVDTAKEIFATEMEKLGATMVDGLWQYEGEPVEIIVLIRNEDERQLIGDYVASQLETIGFTCTRDYKAAADASPIWMRGNPMDGKFHVYTGGWVTTAVPRNLADNFSFFYTARGLGVPLWSAYAPSEEFDQLAERIENNDFTTMEERTAMMAQALELALQDSVRVWLVDRASLTPRRAEMQTAYDLYGAVYGTPLWAYTIRFVDQVGGEMTIATASILTEPWNPIGGTNWIYDQMPIRATGDFGLIGDPYTGLALPNRIERAEVVVQEGIPVTKTLDWLTLETAASIEVPADAWADWDAEAQRFITVGEMSSEPVTTKTKTTVYYPADITSTLKWHDGSAFSVADVVMFMIMNFDRAKEASAIYDESAVPDYDSLMTSLKGIRIVSTDPLVIETYSDSAFLDAEDIVTTWFPAYLYGEGAWHTLGLGGLVDASGEATFSAAKADANEVEWLSMISGPTVELLAAQLETAAADRYIPYAPTLGEYITAEQAAERWSNLSDFYATYGHFWIGTGPYYLERAYPVEGTVLLQRFADHPDLATKWDRFGQAAIAVAEVSGSSRVTIGQEATFDVSVTFDDAPYAQTDIEQVKYLVFDAKGVLAATGEAEAVGDGMWQITLDADATSKLESGSNRLEVVVVSKLVAVPTFASMQFVTAP